jgi:ribosome biogenesis protein Nip4
MNGLKEFTENFTGDAIEGIVQIGNDFFQVRPDLDTVRKKVDRSLNREVSYAGIFLGTLRRRRFEPGIALLDIIAQHTGKWIVVDDNAEWLFLCGRDLFGKSITEANTKLGMVIVLNRRKEVLGYGRITGSFDKNDEVCIKNLMDRGDFLRREMTKKGK